MTQELQFPDRPIVPQTDAHFSDPSRPGDWNCTRSGIRFFPLDPRPEDVEITDIAFALSNVSRYAGHVEFYSVAQHCVHVADLLAATRDRVGIGDPRAVVLTGLLHDAGEAYVGDMTRPLKKCAPMGPMFCEIEDNIYRVVAEKFGAQFPLPASVKWADDTLLVTEVRDLHPALARSGWNAPNVEPLETTITRWSPDLARERFMDRFIRLTKGW